MKIETLETTTSTPTFLPCKNPSPSPSWALWSLCYLEDFFPPKHKGKKGFKKIIMATPTTRTKVVKTNSIHHHFHEEKYHENYPPPPAPQYNVGCCVWTKSSQHCSRGKGGDSQIIAIRLLKHCF